MYDGKEISDSELRGMASGGDENLPSVAQITITDTQKLSFYIKNVNSGSNLTIKVSEAKLSDFLQNIKQYVTIIIVLALFVTCSCIVWKVNPGKVRVK